MIDNLENGRNLYLIGTGTGLAPFLSVIKDPETYERFEKVVLLHGCRRVKELAYGEMITEKLPNDELIGDCMRNQLIYYPTVTRDPFRNRGRITDLITSGKLFADIGLASLEAAHDRVMICGSPALVADTRVLLTARALSKAITASRRSSWSKRPLPSAEVFWKLWPHRRRLHRHAAGTRHQIELEFDQFRRAVVVRLGANAREAGAQAALQRSQRLPLQPVQRIAGRMSLRDRRSRQPLVPIVVVAVAAGEIELALPQHEAIAALGDEGRELRIGAGLDRRAARLPRDEGGQRQQFAALKASGAACCCRTRHRLMRCSRLTGRPSALSKAG